MAGSDRRGVVGVHKSARLCLQVLLNEKAKKVDGQYQLSGSGRTVAADKVYVCVGGKPNTAFLKAESTRSILDGRGYVKASLQL